MSEPRPPSGLYLLPVDTSNGECPACGRLHDEAQPHDGQSLYYKYRFYVDHQRWPTWADAMEHCADEVREAWTRALRERGVDV